jgi:hypothetical protein
MSIKPTNPGNHPIKGLNECNTVSPLQEDLNADRVNPVCSNDKEPSLQDVSGPDTSWLEQCSNTKQGIGRHALCDPMQTGQIVEDMQNPNRNVIVRYPKSIRGTDEAMQDLFRNLVVIDEDGKAHPVPIIWGTQERAVQYVLADNVRKDNSLVVDRIKLPLLAIHSTDISFDENRYVYHQALDYLRYYRDDQKPGFTTKERYERDTVFGVARGIPVNISYTLYAWTLYIEDMDQILEQIMLKFSPVAYIRVRGVNWEIIVTKDSTTNNIDMEPGDQNLRVIKYQFNLTAQTYILQPIARKKAVLNIKTDICDKDMDEILGRIEVAVEEFEK